MRRRPDWNRVHGFDDGRSRARWTTFVERAVALTGDDAAR